MRRVSHALQPLGQLCQVVNSREAIDGTKGAFEWVPHGDYRLWLDRFVAKHIDTFKVPLGGDVRGQG
jgi:hypothetical protein